MTIAELEECVDSYGKDIYGFCRQLTGSRQEGEDLYQDTFLKAVELAEKIDKAHNPKSYLLSVAVRLWKNRKRKYAWRQRIAGMESLEEREERIGSFDEKEDKTPEEEILDREINRFVRECIKELPEKQRIVLYLYYTGELSVKEIADCLKLPEGTVKSRLHLARTAVKKKLEVAGYEK